MSKQTDRENFLLTMQTEGVPADVARLVMRHAASLHRLTELQCSSEAYDRDRVRCPGALTTRGWVKDGTSCLCRDYGAFEDHSRHITTCGACKRSWCDYCDPAHGPLCHWCHGRGRSTHRAVPGETPRCSHGTVPRGAVRDELLQARVRKLLAPFNVTPVFQGDPRGAVVKLRVPSGRTDDWGRTGVCVP